MDRRTEIKLLQETIKKLMGARSLTLKDLAHRFGLSIATAKRILNHDDLSLDRVLEFCEWLGIGFRELVEMANAQRGDYHYCTVEQESFLARHLSHFAFLRSLQKGETLTAIVEANGLTDSDTKRYLMDLESKGFLRLHENNYLELIAKDGMDWRPDGPLRIAFMQQWVNETANLYSNTESFIDISQRKLSPKSYKQMLSEIDEISRKFAAISRIEREMDTGAELEFHTCMVIAAPKVAPMWQIKPYGS